MREREIHCCNLVIHNFGEPDEDVTDNKDRIMKDRSMVQNLSGVIGVDIECKVIWPVDEDASSPQHLFVGFKTSDACRTVLDKSSALSVKDEPWSNINIVRNFTKSQRKVEDVEKKNAELSEEELGNWLYKVIWHRMAENHKEGVDSVKLRAIQWIEVG